jgi:hypothetical protein
LAKKNDPKRSNRYDFRHASGADNLRKQYEIDKSIPALQRNYDTSIIAWQNNNGDLFVVLDAEALNMAQIEKLDKLQAILSTQVAIKTTRNEIIMNKIHKI